MNTESNKVSLAFARGNDHEVEGAANTVLANLYDVPELANPPVTKIDLTASAGAFTTALAEMANGGRIATAKKNGLREVVVNHLRDLANFVQIKGRRNLPLLLASGFEATSGNRASVPLPKPVIIRIGNGMSGQTIIAVEANANARSWVSQFALIGEDGVPGPWIDSVPATDSRRILVEDLIPGRMYAHRVRGIGGANGITDWSDTIIHRAV